jgi:hypothetical protein
MNHHLAAAFQAYAPPDANIGQRIAEIPTVSGVGRLAQKAVALKHKRPLFMQSVGLDHLLKTLADDVVVGLGRFGDQLHATGDAHNQFIGALLEQVFHIQIDRGKGVFRRASQLAIDEDLAIKINPLEDQPLSQMLPKA